jgi:anti-sigma B factor antagonist
MEWKRAGRLEDGYEVLAMAGECDLYSAPLFAASVIAMIQKGERSLEIDMSEVRYLDSTGVGSIVRILQAMRERKGQVRFRGIGGMPRRVLKMSNVINLMVEREAAAEKFI